MSVDVTSGPATCVGDVTSRVPISGGHHIAAWVFPPAVVEGPVPVVVCLSGGTYSKAYWHVEVPGRTGYSLAEHLAAQGMLVIALDHIGTGDSSRHPRAAELTPDVVAAANAAALDTLRARIADGTLIEGLASIEVGPVVGVGHSMGAMLTIFQQSLHGSFDAIAPLGYGTIGPIITFGDVGSGFATPSYEAAMAIARSGAIDEPTLADRTLPDLRHHFYWDDVPEDVIAADEAQTNSHLPGVTGLLSIVPYIASDHAGRVRCPVFIGLGERDSTPDHHSEPRGYRSSGDVTLFLLPRSGHCHNSASTRHLLWNRLAGWIHALPTGQP